MKRRGPPPGDSFDRLRKAVEQKAPAALAAAAAILESEIKLLLSTPGRGRIRQGGIDRLGKGSFTTKSGVRKLVRRGVARTKIDLTNRASLPGDPPAPDTGTLRNSIHFEFGPDGKSVRVGSNMEYAAVLEFGGRPRGGKTNRKAGRAVLGALIGGIAPRPFMRPALARSREAMKNATAEHLREAAKILARINITPRGR